MLFNLCLIGALLSADAFESVGAALSYGVLGAVILQLVWLWAAARRAGVRMKISLPKFDLKIKKVFKLMGPGVIGAGVMHINLFADMVIASFLAAGSISYLYYADRLNQLPLGVVGIAVGTALLPMLSKALSKGDVSEGRDLFNRALEMCLLLALPAAVALAVVPQALIGTLFERGAFSAEDAAQTVRVLQAYAVGLPAYIAIKVFSTAHWARQDTKTPVKISVVATVLNIVLSLILIQFMGVAGIALATGLTGWLQFVLHIRALRDVETARFDDRFKRALPRIVLSTCVMAGVLFIVAAALDGVMARGGIEQIGGLTIIVLSGLGVYGAASVFSGAVNLRAFKAYLSKGKV